MGWRSIGYLISPLHSCKLVMDTRLSKQLQLGLQKAGLSPGLGQRGGRQPLDSGHESQAAIHEAGSRATEGQRGSGFLGELGTGQTK